MKCYGDTGFLLSLYLPETTTPAANAAMQSIKPPVLLAPLGLLELRVALHLAVFRKHIAEAQRKVVWQLIEQDLAAGLLMVAPVPSVTWHDAAAQLAEKYSATIGTRTPDLMHVAAAMILDAKLMLSFDARQRKAAECEGLRLLPAQPA
jgi:hypothetical protein